MSHVRPDEILDFWIGSAGHDATALEERMTLWFGKSDTVDAEIRARFLPTLEHLEDGLAEDWAGRGPRTRLAAVIALDQFPRNIFRGTARAFAYDRLALGVVKDGLMSHADEELTEPEQVFFYLPLEHSESQADQALCVSLMEKLARSARPAFKTFAEKTLDFAYRHKAVIDRYGRFPHRNHALGRESTAEEEAYLAQPGAGF
ncbi:MAG: DUF924 domain-containing protein [Hyphomonadaceae bacterium]|nr:DUF924 domain-containing protein [Hyphomonadaceae bacterium]